MAIQQDIIRVIDAGLQVVIDKDGDCFVVRALCSGKAIAKGSDDRFVEDAVSKMVADLIALNGPKAVSQDDMLAKVFS